MYEYLLYWAVETDKAYGVKDDPSDADMIWLPKSQVDIEGSAALNRNCTFLIPEWLAIEKGLE